MKGRRRIDGSILTAAPARRWTLFLQLSLFRRTLAPLVPRGNPGLERDAGGLGGGLLRGAPQVGRARVARVLVRERRAGFERDPGGRRNKKKGQEPCRESAAAGEVRKSGDTQQVTEGRRGAELAW